MQATIQDLGKLKRSVALEISLEEIKPTYDTIIRKVKNTRLKGFRPGKFPKGWVDKRFKEFVTAEAVEKIIPQYYNEALDKEGVYPATQAVIEDLKFDKKSSLTATLNFEIKPVLTLPEYTKIELDKKDIEVSDEDIDQRIEMMRKSQGNLKAKSEDSVAEPKDIATIDYKGTLDGKDFENSQKDGLKFEVEGDLFKEFSPHVLNMKTGETKTVSIELPEGYGDNVGKIAEFEITLTTLENFELPELNEDFFKNIGKDNEEDFRNEIKEMAKQEAKNRIYGEYYDAVKKQLLSLYEDFDMPESLILRKQEELDKQIAESNNASDKNDDAEKTELSDEEKESQKAEMMRQYKEGLKTSYILDYIGRTESVAQNNQKTFERFARLASLFQTTPEEFVKTDTGYQLYVATAERVHQEEILDFVISKVFDEPLETEQSSESTT